MLLDVPLNGLDPELNHLGTKSGSRKVFREAGVPHPPGYEDLKDTGDVERALVELGREHPGLSRAVVKLNESFSGEGNAVFRFPDSGDARVGARRAWAASSWRCASESHEAYFRKFARMGGIVEAFIDAPHKLSPSAQLRTTPRGEVVATSTHDQILGGPSGQIYQGCTFPAHEDYRRAIQDAGMAIGRVLAAHGAVSRFGVDFLVSRHDTDAAVDAARARDQPAGARHHPSRSSRCSSSPAAGSIPNPACSSRSAAAPSTTWPPTTCARPAYRGVLPEDLIDIVTNNGLHYSYRTESGVLFHLIGALSEWGKLGVTVIANSRDEVNELYRRTLAVLDREAGLGHAPAVTGRHA